LLKYDPHVKRILDIVLAASAIFVLLPLFCFIIILIRMDSSGPVFFRQKRIGKHYKPFSLIKFRTMRQEKGALRRQFEPGDDRRVTRLGKVLRKTKLDELPELLNVFIGDMSIVGPRPEVEKYVTLFRDDYDLVLKVRPGLSDFASIKYRNEEEILAGRANSEKYYIDEILPDKLKLARVYIENISLKTDMYIIVETIKSILSKDSDH
jgi:lipopolysaccharide/colanic/teichoic acid biosynthesis glycosyltransferase